MAFSSYFEATPPRRRDSEDSDEVPILNFRSFGSAPKVFFKNVAIGERVSKTLLLRNQQTEALEVELLKLPPPDSGVEFSCKKWQINPRSQTALEIIWQPTKEGKSIHSIHVKTNTNALFFFSIVCVSISKKIICEPREKAAVRLIEKWYYSILQKKEEAKRLEFEKQLEEQQQQAILRNYATKIQAWWRGIIVRKKVDISHVLPHIETSKYVLDERFSLRTVYSKALSSFQSSPSLSYTVLLNAGLLIESAVRLSPEICNEFLSSSHLDTVILLLGAMNRSLPAENLICVLLKTLTHVLRHPLGNQRVLENERTIPCLVDLTGIWCTKRTEETFCHVCTVWWLLAQDCNTAQILRDSRIVSTQLLKCYTKIKSWNVHTPGSSSATPMKSHLPTLRPWWCSKKINRPRIFENGKFGIIGVLKKLHIDFH